MLKNVWALIIHFCRIVVFSCYTGITSQSVAAADDLSRFLTTMATVKHNVELNARGVLPILADAPDELNRLKQLYIVSQANTNGLLQGLAQYARLNCGQDYRVIVEAIDGRLVNEAISSGIAFVQAAQAARHRRTGFIPHKSGFWLDWIGKTMIGEAISRLFKWLFSIDDCATRVEKLVIQLDELRIEDWESLPLNVTTNWQDQLNPIALVGTVVESLLSVVSDYHYLNIIGSTDDIPFPLLTFEPVLVQQD